MLVLTRKTGETITIDGEIKIQIVQVRGRQVKVGIEAPKHKKVERGELARPDFKKSLLQKISPTVKAF